MTGPAVAAFGLATAPVSVPAFVGVSGTEGAYLGSLTRGASGGSITAGTVAIDGGLGVAGGLVGRYVAAPLAGRLIARFGPATETHAPGTIGHLLSDYHPDSFIHITPDAPGDFAAGINEGTYFSRLEDVAHLTPEEFRTTVVGPLAPGYYPDAKLFVVVGREASGSFRALPPEAVNLTGTSEYVNTERLTASGFVKAH